MPSSYDRVPRTVSYVRLLRVKDDDSDIAFEILNNDDRPTIPPYVACHVLTPSDYWKIGEKTQLSYLCSYTFGQNLEVKDWKECRVYIKRLIDDEHSRLVFGIYKGDSDDACFKFYPLDYGIGDEVTVATVHIDELRKRE